MAIPLKPNTQIFSADQRINFSANYWDTTTTAVRVGEGVAVADRNEAFGTGLTFAMFDLLQSGFNIDTVDPETDLNDTSLMRSVLGYDGAAYRTGVVPNIYSYWGAGTPSGGSRAKQVLLKYSGYIHETTGLVSLVFAGQGTLFVRLRHTNGTYTTLIDGAIHEPNSAVDTALVTPTIIREDWGYQFTTARSFLAGEQVEIFYWHDGEAWGGLAAKVVAGSLSTSSDAFLTEVREAPVLGVSFMAKEAAPLAAQSVNYLLSAEIKQQVEQIPEAHLSVALTSSDEADGYSWDAEAQVLVDNATPANTLRKGRVIHIEGGFRQPDGTDELYPRFTGYIDEIFPAKDNSSALITCRGFDGRLTETYDENSPDRLDYHASGFILREPSSEPVFGIPAADHWPVETFLMALCAKAGIDHYNLGLAPGVTVADADHGRFRYADDTTGATYFGGRLFAARALATPTKLIQLERNANYGNVPPVEKDFLPQDDPYLFKPQVTQRLYDRLKSVTEHFGYDVFFNPEGQFVLTGRNNPVYFQYATNVGTYSAAASDVNQLVHVSAVGGIYHGVKHSVDAAWTRVVSGHFSRLDMYFGVGENADGLNGGKLSVLVERADGVGGWVTVSTTEYSTFVDTEESFYYDGLLNEDGTNAAILKILELPFDEYRVTVSAAGPDTASDPLATDCWYRLNGFAVFERNPEQSYYMNDGVPHEFSTLGNAFSLAAESNFKELRNHVLVVGGRRATVTDSDKFTEESLAEGNNPEREFHVAVAVDPFSIYDPTSDNFVGMKRMTVIFDDKISDSGHASWLTRAILLRYKNPPNSAGLSHSVVPALELRDAIHVVEEANLSVQHLVWVTGFTEKWTPTEATTDIETVAYPEIPSYQPREDIDIDSLFVDPADGKGEPVIDMQISYKNLYGRTVTNSTLTNASDIKGFATRTKATRHQPMYSEVITSGISQALTFPAVPETMYLAWSGTSGITHTAASRAGGEVADINAQGYQRFKRRALVNGPYRHFWNNVWSPGTNLPTMHFDFQEGDGSADTYDQAYYGFPTTEPWRVMYDYLLPRVYDVATEENPFYDPYTSELGNLVDISFSLLVSGRVRVSVWAFSESLGMEVPVAWLTSPSADSEKPEAHWQFMESGLTQFSFDGVDNIGLWNSLQSMEYAQSMKGSFGEKPMAVGKGFYAWNDKSTNLHTLIGDDSEFEAAKPNYDANGEPYYTIGQYSQFYVKVEVANDELMRRDFSNGTTAPRVVDSRTLPTTNGMNDVDETYIWQHLGEPTQVGIRIQDWGRVDAFGALTETWTPGAATDDADWTSYSDPDDDATLRVGKPVRITFQSRPHRGPMWEDATGALDASSISAKLTRAVHHKGTVFDQFWAMSGKSWDGFHKDWAGDASSVENKRLQNRMFHNEDHTLEYEDTAWRTGTSIDSYEWIFDPTLFEKDFGLNLKEKLRYADYEQLEQLPGFDTKQLGGTAAGQRAYMMLAYLSHLFYFSAFTIDRSGRRQHCINSWTDDLGNKRGWIDKTKIVTPTVRAASSDPASLEYSPEYILDYERRGADRYLARSMFVRQWQEPGWADGTYTGSPVTAYDITSAHELSYVQVKSTTFDLNNDPHPLTDDLLGVTDLWLQEYVRTGSAVNQMVRYRKGEDALSTPKTLDLLAESLHFIPAGFGTWTWDRPGLTNAFLPNPCRDFHPYVRYPVTPDHVSNVDRYTPTDPIINVTDALNVFEAPVSNLQHTHRDFSAQELWFGYAFTQAYAEDWYDTHPASGIATRYRHYGARLEQTVEELGEAGPNSRNDTNGMIRTRIEALFDYVKQDQLDRWEQFRGMRARAPYADRGDWGAANWKRRASMQPVKPSGTYLFSTARLGEIALAPVAPNITIRCHWTDEVSNFFDLRFWHEYVWYSDRYFPVTRLGGAMYMFLRDEYTGVSGWLGFPWEGGPLGEQVDPVKAIFYDAGAWTGWRPDSSGTTLRWKEGTPITLNVLTGRATETLHGDESNEIFVATPWEHDVSFHTAVYNTRANILDEYYSKAAGPRHAVAPELTSEQKNIYLNLALPERLRGD